LFRISEGGMSRMAVSWDPPGHGSSHGYLGHEFVLSILEKRLPLVNIAWALNLTVAGTVAHQSVWNDGEWLKISQYRV